MSNCAFLDKPGTSTADAPRSRSRSPRRRAEHDRDGKQRNHQNKPRRPKRDDRNRNKESGKEKGDHKKNNKSEYTFSSPGSFEEAWSGSFFSPSILLLITTLGFVVNRIPVLHNIPIGGRLRLCIDAWKRVTSNNWVCNVISDGYKIPFKSIPHQYNPPTNPPTKGPAYDVLVQEAIALQNKVAVVPAAPLEGQYISTYFAVPTA